MAAEDIRNIQTTINVKKLISAFENKATEQEETIYSRPRARSLGNFLADNVIIREKDFKTLADIDEELQRMEQALNEYRVYNKAKHVRFQEDLFNILTSIINQDDDDSNTASTLIKKTKSLVNILNNKLPSITVTNETQYQEQSSVSKYKIYEPNQVGHSFNAESNTSTQTPSIKPPESSDVDGVSNIESNHELDNIVTLVSVRKLKEKFQTPVAEKPKLYKSKSMYFKRPSNKVMIETKEQNSSSKVVIETREQHSKNKVVIETRERNSIQQENINENSAKTEEKEIKLLDPVRPETKNPVSITKLKHFFELKSKEGLSAIVNNEKHPITKFNYKDGLTEEPSLQIINSTATHTITDNTSRLLTLLKKDNGSLPEYKFTIINNNTSDGASNEFNSEFEEEFMRDYNGKTESSSISSVRIERKIILKNETSKEGNKKVSGDINIYEETNEDANNRYDSLYLEKSHELGKKLNYEDNMRTISHEEGADTDEENVPKIAHEEGNDTDEENTSIISDKDEEKTITISDQEGNDTDEDSTSTISYE